MTASRLSAPCISRSKARCTARRPFALEMTTGFAAQRLGGGGGRGGRIGCGISRAAAAAMPTAVDARNSRRDRISSTCDLDLEESGIVLAAAVAPVNLLLPLRHST